MINKDIAKIVGQPLNLSDGKITRAVSVSGPGDLGMGSFSPKKGSNKQGKYIVDGIGGMKGYGGSRSSVR